MPGIRDFKQSLQRRLDKKQDVTIPFRAVLCDSTGLTSGSGSVWANENTRLVWYLPIGGGQPAQVRCMRLEPQLGMGVIIGYADGSVELEVLNDDPFLRDSNTTGTPYMTVSPRDLEPGGRLQMWLYSEAFVPLAVWPGTGLAVNIGPGDYEAYDGTRKSFIGKANLSIAAHQPAGPNEHCLVGIYLNSSNVAATVAGATVGTGTVAPEPSWPANSFRLAVVDLDDTQTTLSLSSDITDRRLHFSYPGSGGILKSFLDAKGDLITATAADTPAILTVGTDGQYLGADGSAAAGLGWKDGPAPFPVLNTSGGAVAVGDVGYIDSAGEFKTTTTANLNATWAVVIVGGADSADIYVARRGRVTVNYTGSDPAAGDYLVTSTSAGDAQASTTMRPEIFAVCTAAGSGGQVEALLLCNTVFVPVTDTNAIYDIANHSSTRFEATINGAPTATSVVYNAPSAGAEDAIVPASATCLAKLRLYNSTRSTYRLITSVDAGTNTITTVSSVDAWANTDSITAESQTVSTAAAFRFFELDLSQQTAIPVQARLLLFELLKQDSGGSAISTIHPVETYAASKEFGIATPGAAVRNYRTMVIPLFNRRFAYRSAASGSGTVTVEQMKLMGYWEAAP